MFPFRTLRVSLGPSIISWLNVNLTNFALCSTTSIRPFEHLYVAVNTSPRLRRRSVSAENGTGLALALPGPFTFTDDVDQINLLYQKSSRTLAAAIWIFFGFFFDK